MSGPDPDDFRALARSSPWRWSTLRFTARWSGPWVLSDPVRARLRRPDRLRVETLDGALVELGRRGSGPATAVLTADGGAPASADPGGAGPAVRLRPDGLVDWRPPVYQLAADDPMYVNYSWVAMLDPVELADGDADREGEGVVVGQVSETEHGGRPAWQAVVSTTPAYEPRCSCCPLLPSADAAALEEREGSGARRTDGFEHGATFLVRLDLGTGVCVLTEQLDGTDLGRGHDVRIEAVDEPMGDELFTRPRRGILRR